MIKEKAQKVQNNYHLFKLQIILITLKCNHFFINTKKVW
jgi:hypothetical protein